VLEGELKRALWRGGRVGLRGERGPCFWTHVAPGAGASSERSGARHRRARAARDGQGGAPGHGIRPGARRGLAQRIASRAAAAAVAVGAASRGPSSGARGRGRRTPRGTGRLKLARAERGPVEESASSRARASRPRTAGGRRGGRRARRRASRRGGGPNRAGALRLLGREEWAGHDLARFPSSGAMPGRAICVKGETEVGEMGLRSGQGGRCRATSRGSPTGWTAARACGQLRRPCCGLAPGESPRRRARRRGCRPGRAEDTKTGCPW